MSLYDTVAKLDTYLLDVHKFNFDSCLYLKFIFAGWMQQKYDPSLIDSNDDEKEKSRCLFYIHQFF